MRKKISQQSKKSLPQPLLQPRRARQSLPQPSLRPRMPVASLMSMLSIILALMLLCCACGTNGGEKQNGYDPDATEEILDPGKFKNPISDKSRPDPFIFYHDGYYYGLATEVSRVRLYRSRAVETLFKKGEHKDLIKKGDDIGNGRKLGGNIWAPELHYYPETDRWYVYACASIDGTDFAGIRMFCLESAGSDPFGEYTYKGVTLNNKLCIDQTVYYDETSGELYTAYSDFTDMGQVIMLAAMDEPWKVGKERVRVSYPLFDWETRGTGPEGDGRVNEGPIFLEHNGDIFLLYSASGCWTEFYSLGMLRYTGENTAKENFLDAANWEKSKFPVFEKGNGVYGVGHCSFFSSPDGTETWMAYHGMASPDAGVSGRYAYIQKIGFDENGVPVFGQPLPRTQIIDVPRNGGQEEQ